jgi:hypothetical protein
MQHHQDSQVQKTYGELRFTSIRVQIHLHFHVNLDDATSANDD